MKRSKIMASVLTAAMLFSAVPVQAVLADETDVSLDEAVVTGEDSGIQEEEVLPEEIVVEEDDVVINEITTEETDLPEETEAVVEVEEAEELFEAEEAVTGIPINEDTFPDAVFRAYVEEHYDDGDYVLSSTEINAVSFISVKNMGITSLDGVEYFTSITSLDCTNNNLTSLALSNPRLGILTCSNNSLVSLDISNLPALYNLNCDHNNLSEIDLGSAPRLHAVGCSNNRITTLVIPDDVNYLDCRNNPIQSIDIRLNKYLTKTVKSGNKTVSEGVVTYDYVYPLERGDLNCQLKISEGLNILLPDPGWNKVNGNWYFILDYYGYLTGWYWGTIPGDIGRYYFNENGVMQTSWLQLDGKWYYFGSDGDIELGWVKIGGKWYYFNEDVSDYYTRGVMQTSWQKIGGSWYYFKSGGDMATGWQKIGDKWYYFKSSGAMVTGWQKISNKWYYFESSGAMKTGWLKSGGKWYYFESSGAMLANCSKKIGSKTYRFDANGACINP